MAWHRFTALFITVVPAVIKTIAHRPLRDATVVSLAAEFCVVVTVVSSGRALVDGLIGVVSTIIVYVTLPALRDTATIVTLELARPAGPAGAVRSVLI